VIRKLLALTGEILVSLGLLIGLYVVYQVSFSNSLADAAATEVAAKVEARLDTSIAQSESTDTDVFDLTPNQGEGFALLYIPRLKGDVWGTPIVEGTSYKALASGVGHYSRTEMPGEAGNFAIAGHRATNGEPFARFELLRAGDLVYIHSPSGWFTYELFQDQKIPKTGVWVLDDQPRGVISESNQIITLTTCDPRWNSTQRWAWWGQLVYAGEDAPRELVG
jgi:sortase A